jgi:hypothetical protein
VQVVELGVQLAALAYLRRRLQHRDRTHRPTWALRNSR